jgi:hypothetical protein
MNKYLFTCLLSFSTISLFSQTPWDAIFMGKNELCIAAIYDQASFDQYWEGETLIRNQNLGKFTRRTFLPMLAYGINGKIDIIAIAPYISTSSTAGQLAGVSGFQDFTIAIKGRFAKFETSAGNLAIIGLAGFSTPMTNYSSDYMPYSLGLGCNEVSLRATAEFNTNFRLYTRASAAYLMRGYSEIERTYYYNNGSYYSTFMEVPDAWTVHAALGYLALDGRLRMELTYLGMKCVSGDDIRSWYRPQPTNKTQYDQAGFFVQYYLKNLDMISLVGYYNTMFSGRNIGKFSNFSVGATYQFFLSKKEKANG